MLLFIATGFGIPHPKNSKKMVAIFNNASKDVGFVVHNIRRRRSAPGDDDFNLDLEETLLDMNEDTMQLAMKDEAKALPQNDEAKAKEAKQDNDDSGVNFKRKVWIAWKESLDNLGLDLDDFNLGEKVLDMNEESLELAMEDEEDGVQTAQAMVKNATSFLLIGILICRRRSRR